MADEGSWQFSSELGDLRDRASTHDRTQASRYNKLILNLLACDL